MDLRVRDIAPYKSLPSVRGFHKKHIYAIECGHTKMGDVKSSYRLCVSQCVFGGPSTLAPSIRPGGAWHYIVIQRSHDIYGGHLLE